MTTYFVTLARDATFVCAIDRTRHTGACIELRGHQARDAASVRGVTRLARKLDGAMRDAVARGAAKGWRSP